MFNKPRQQKYGRQRKLNYTSIPSAFSFSWRKIKVELMSKTHNNKTQETILTRIYLMGLPRKLKQILFGLY